VEGEAVINGYLGISDGILTIVLAMNSAISSALTTPNSTIRKVSPHPTMPDVPHRYRKLVSLHEDDTATVSALYPAVDISTTYGVLSGVFTKRTPLPSWGPTSGPRKPPRARFTAAFPTISNRERDTSACCCPRQLLHQCRVHPDQLHGRLRRRALFANATSASFQAPHPITPVAFQNATPGTVYSVNISAGCNADITFRLDGSGSVNSTTCVNHAPAAQDAAVSTKQNTPLHSAVIAMDQDNDPLTYHIVAQGTRGSATMDAATGAYTYTPQPGVTGTDNFTFVANDGKLDSNIATVTITIVPMHLRSSPA